MPIVSTDIKYRLSGGSSNTDPTASLGGVKSTTDASTNLLDTVSSAEAAAGDVVHGVAMEYATAPTADGDKEILVDVSGESVYRYPPDAGTVTVALIGVTMDVGGAQSINIDASADDCILVRDVDTANNLVFIQIRPAFAGVV